MPTNLNINIEAADKWASPAILFLVAGFLAWGGFDWWMWASFLLGGGLVIMMILVLPAREGKKTVEGRRDAEGTGQSA